MKILAGKFISLAQATICLVDGMNLTQLIRGSIQGFLNSPGEKVILRVGESSLRKSHTYRPSPVLPPVTMVWPSICMSIESEQVIVPKAYDVTCP